MVNFMIFNGLIFRIHCALFFFLEGGRERGFNFLEHADDCTLVFITLLEK